MKKNIMSLLVSMVFLGVLPLHADQVSENTAEMIKNRFGIDITQYSVNANKSAKKTSQSVSSSNFAYQYTNDGFLQLIVVYADSVIGTNLEGPREGFQVIMMYNGALLDTCNSYKIHSDYCSHKYTWGEVRTYNTYQTVIFK